MATIKTKFVNNSETKVEQKGSRSVTMAPIRVRQKTKTRLDQLLKQANKDRLGRKIKTDDLIAFGLALITDEHISEICHKTLSNKDRLEMLFLKLTKERRCSSREEFFGLLLEGKVAI
ncbi:MAG: hypothetical protein NT027_19215 [Proteobacteria bacterium]|nr:hypothetical protein [Pseudomonadota bacterium]